MIEFDDRVSLTTDTKQYVLYSCQQWRDRGAGIESCLELHKEDTKVLPYTTKQQQVKRRT